MGTGKDKIALFPSQANLNLMVIKHVSATRGLGYLRKKRDALLIQLRQINTEMHDKNLKLPGRMRKAIFALNRAKYLGVDLNVIGERVPKVNELYVTTTKQNVVGVILPKFLLHQNRRLKAFPLLGLGKGGQQLVNLNLAFREIIEFFLELASLVYAEKALSEACKQINMRSNALEYIIIPRIKRTIEYIKGELDEYSREEFYRLKKAQASHQKKALLKELVKANDMEVHEAVRKSLFNTINSTVIWEWTISDWDNVED